MRPKDFVGANSFARSVIDMRMNSHLPMQFHIARRYILQ